MRGGKKQHGLTLEGRWAPADFFDNGLGHAAGEALAQLLEFKQARHQKHAIQVLILDCNPKMGTKGTVPLFRALAEDSVITTLHLEQLGFGDTGELSRARVKRQGSC